MVTRSLFHISFISKIWEKSRPLSRLFNKTADGMASLQEDPWMPLYTRILSVNVEEIGNFSFSKSRSFLDPWTLETSSSSSAFNLLEAADSLRSSLYPVAFPTETVYGLGANALSSQAVKGIYTAKQRPADNPLIVHIASLDQLRRLLSPTSDGSDPIPQVYLPLIQRFWPGPLSILLPNPEGSRIAPEVTAGQPTFAARMPSNRLALALIQLFGLPLAAPAANASTIPSPTAAQHVAHDLEGRIEIILDGGPCNVGVESTVVDGLSDLPCILRPGGIGIEEIRKCKGWQNVVTAYKDRKPGDMDMEVKPRAPGMKYKHYSPTAKVVLIDSGASQAKVQEQVHQAVKTGTKSIGVVRTRKWDPIPGETVTNGSHMRNAFGLDPQADGYTDSVSLDMKHIKSKLNGHECDVWDVSIGPSVADVARGLFSALREFDLKGVEIIFVEGIEDQGETAAAVMNRLSKAASEWIGP